MNGRPGFEHVVGGNPETMIADVAWGRPAFSENAANAQLIAQAPVMLKAIVMHVDAIHRVFHAQEDSPPHEKAAVDAHAAYELMCGVINALHKGGAL